MLKKGLGLVVIILGVAFCVFGANKAETVITFSHPVFATSLTLSGQSFTASESAEPAYRILEDLANRKHKVRIMEGTKKLVIGIAGAVVFGVIESRFWSPPWISITIGGAYAIGGVITLMTPSEAEREYAKASAMAPPEREAYSLICLQRLAGTGYERRMYTAVMNIAFGTAWLLWSFYQPSLLWYLIGLSNLATGVYHLLVPSEEERALQMYHELKGTSSLEVPRLGRVTAYGNT